MINRTDFHCITTWVACSSGCNSAKPLLISAQESFYLQGVLNDINEQDTSFPDSQTHDEMRSST